MFAYDTSGAGPLVWTVMRTRKAAIVGLALTAGSGLIVLGTWPWCAPVDVRVTKTESAQMFDDSGAEMVLVTLAFSRPAHASWICVKSGAELKSRIAGQWKMLDNTLSLSSLAGGETRQEVILMPGNADRCRIHLAYAGASTAWRFGGWLSRRGLKLRPKYWNWAGWPRAEGPKPRWKNYSIELPLAQNPGTDRASNAAHNHAIQRMRASRLARSRFVRPLRLALTADGGR